MNPLPQKIFLAILCVIASAFAQQRGTVHDSYKFKSSVLKKEVNYVIYLPPGYNPDAHKYPVLFLLHGYTDNHKAWLISGEMDKIPDDLINKNEIMPLIIVSADVGNSWYLNAAEDSLKRYEDMYINEFIPFIEKQYGAVGAKNGRFIGGLSMGGYGSLLYAMKYPQMFSVCVAMSAAILTDEELVKQFKSGKVKYGLKPLYGIKDETLGEMWEKNSIINLASNMPEQNKSATHFYIDIGDDDLFYRGNSILHIVMSDAKIKHEYRVRDGDHIWAYWRQCLRDGLIYINSVSKTENK